MNKSLGILKSPFLLIGFLAAGALTGIFWPQAAGIVKPVGDIFMNLLFVLVVPLVFFNVCVSFQRMSDGGNVGKVLLLMFVAFSILWLSSSVLAFLGVAVVNPLGDVGPELVRPKAGEGPGDWRDSLSGAFSVSDFSLLFSISNLLPLIVFSAIVGLGVSKSGEKGRKFGEFLQSGAAVTDSAMSLLMYAAPVGLGCYFAYMVASVGNSLLSGYLRAFLIYLALSLIVIFMLFPLIAAMCRGKGAIREWWRHILPPSLTAMATQSSSAAIPGNIVAAKGLGVDEAVAETVIPVGTNLLKAGSVMGGVIKVAFLMSLCSQSYLSPLAAAMCIGVAILSAVVSGAVAGGNAPGDFLICTMLGIDPGMAGLIIIIGTIIDMPATFVNSQSTVIAALIVDRKSTR